MSELILLPWVLFKYIFSLGLWGALFITLHYQWKKHDCSDWTIGKLRQMRKKKPVEDDIDWENGVQ